MKKIILFVLFLCAFAPIISAKIDSVSVADFAFTPSSFDAAVGDTILWTLVSGTHTTTSTSVPAGAPTWNHSFSGIGDSFSYIVTVEGVYEYHCSIHADMKASFETQVPLPFVADFDFPAGDLLSNHGWMAHSGIGTQPITVNNGGLTFPNYPSSGIGNAALLDNNGEDVHRLFENVTGGAVYTAFMVDVEGFSAGYFLHYAPNPHNTFDFRARVWLKGTAPNYEFGLSFSSSDTIFTAPVYSVGSTYLVIVKYEIIDGDYNDAVSLFVFNDSDPFPNVEPSPTLGPLTNTSITQFDIIPGSINLRQYNASENVIVDGIRIGTSWSEVVPVELSSFTAFVSSNNVILNWKTSTETNNKGFEIQRKTVNSDWTNIAFENGQGTSTQSKVYSYTDKNLESGNYSYRLKQVDFNGTYEYSNVIAAEVTAPAKFELAQNFPNPFNPATKINFSIPSDGSVKLTVYNLLGQKISTLVNGFMKVGSHTVNFSGQNLNSGLYFYKLESNGSSIVKKMILLK
ncbi:MAG TPA: T9SS type A sorting domain-containing protein [Ignavibacteriaceae bacterium]|nr:T9SS type A sorting domain-containing protein [Ignavibacteriaceae bacterium]